jgi:uncharacterized heparinase superfamily protein
MPEGKEKNRLWRSLPRRSSAELRTRALQEIRKRWDLMLYLSGFSFGSRRRNSEYVPAGHFFFSPSDLPAITQIVREKLPDQARQIIERAERICRHRFDLLGYEDLDYRRRIDWHLDVVHGKRAPVKPWFKIRYLDFGEVGDSKVIWELNRHQHLVTLAKAYQLTGEDRFAAEVIDQWYDWGHCNPYPLGVNWASSLEVAFRSLSWLWVWHLLAGARGMSTAFLTDLFRGLEISGRHIERYLSTYFSPNTHLLGEGVALLFIGTLCPELGAAAHWKQLGWQIVLREAERQVQPDGTHFEQSVHYHVYALDFFLHSRILAACNEVPIPPAFDQTIERMLEALCLLAQAGPVPQLGDDDGGRVFNSRRNRAKHLTDPLSTGAVLLNRADFKSAAGSLCEETLWLLGAGSAAQFDGLPASEPLAASGRLDSSGICVMASSGQRREKLVIDAGPLGHGNAGHGHADSLSLALTINGRQWLVDPGTHCYVSGENERDKFRGTTAHNTLQVDGLDQAEPSGPFVWRSLPHVSVDRWLPGKTFDFFSGKHDGYCRLPHPVIHRRCVFHLKERLWLVLDRAEGEGKHQLALHWHLASGITHAPAGSHSIVLKGPDGQSLAFLPAEGQAWRQEIKSGEVSSAYGRSEPGVVLCFSAAALLPAEFAILMLPFEQSASDDMGQANFSALQHANGFESVSGYQYAGPGETHSFFFARRPHSWTVGPWASDAHLMYCGTSEDGRLHLILGGGSFLKCNGRPILRCDVQLERWELVVRESDREEFCSDETARRDVNVNAFTGVEGLHGEVVSRKGTG